MSFEKPWGNYLIDAIIETPAPDSISFWPETLAWKILFFFIILLVLKTSYRAWQCYQENLYRREALNWLTNCSLSNEADIRQLPAVIRKTALLAIRLEQQKAKTEQNQSRINYAIEQHHKVCQLSGEAWLIWLDEQCSKTCFKNKNVMYSNLLNTLAYAPNLAMQDSQFTRQLNSLVQQCFLWIKHHNVSSNFQNSFNSLETNQAGNTLKTEQGKQDD